MNTREDLDTAWIQEHEDARNAVQQAARDHFRELYQDLVRCTLLFEHRNGGAAKASMSLNDDENHITGSCTTETGNLPTAARRMRILLIRLYDQRELSDVSINAILQVESGGTGLTTQWDRRATLKAVRDGELVWFDKQNRLLLSRSDICKWLLKDLFFLGQDFLL